LEGQSLKWRKQTGFAKDVTANHMAMLDNTNDAMRHAALHVLFASDVDKAFLATKLTLIKKKDPSDNNRHIAGKMLADMLE